ncbi:MAG: response regulator [Candidatus Rokubacteria bacterium]|nr:response regulator [Candidatus Rokubacteria bacterium]
MKIRTHLFMLTAGTIVPLVAFGVFAVLVLGERERETFRAGASARTLAVLTAVDAELRSSISTLEAIGASRALHAGDLRRFHDEVTRALASQPEWLSINLADADGRQLLNARVPFGEPLPPVVDGESLDRAARTGKPAIGIILIGTVTGRHEFSVRVPIRAAGGRLYVLSAVVSPAVMSAILAAQRLPGDWVGVVLDAQDRFVARTVGAERFLGQPASDSLRAALARAPEGWFHGTTVEGAAVYTPYTRSAFSGWSVALGIPEAVVGAAGRRTVALMSGVVAGIVAVAVLLGLLLVRRITQPIAALASAARALGAGDAPAVPGAASVAEIGALARALGDAAAAIREREDALRASDRAKDQFLAMLGHELRNPLGAIGSAAAIMEAAPDSVDVGRRARAVIGRQVTTLTRLVDDLLDVSRVTTGKVVLVRRPVDLGALVDRVVADWQAAGRCARHVVTVETFPVWVDGDPIRLEQIATNLLGNALKYTPDGGAVALHVTAHGEGALLEVADTGTGIPSEQLATIFELFVQGDRALDRAPGGLGVGLTLVKALVTMHGGTVEAFSDGPGRGARFAVRLPRIEPVAASPAATPAPARERRRVLVIEDGADAREMLRVALGLEGHEVHVASDGLEGVKAVEDLGPDVAVIDLGLPGVDGYEVARRIRSGRRRASIVLIALTGYGRPEDQRRAMEAGFDLHVTKPVAPDRLAEIIATAARR